MSEITSEMLAFWSEMAARQAMLHELRPTDGNDFRSVARKAMPALIAEVERLRAELDIHMGIAASAIYHGAKRSAESQWQPMETAPRDGTMVLMWTECGVVIGFWGQRANQWLRPASSHNKDLEDVRHWMPLPKPPEQNP